MKSARLPLLCAFFSAVAFQSVCAGKEKASSGRALRSQIGTLYDLRSKLVKGSSSTTSQHEKEGRGYSYHYNPSDLTHPAFSASYGTHNFHSRMGKIAETPKKKSDKNWDKYSKYVYKTGDESPGLNSFNIVQHTSEKNASGKAEKQSTAPPTSTLQPTPSPSSTSTTKKPATPATSSSGFDFNKIAAIGLGINDAMTSALTQKLMSMIDQDFPQGIFKPLKHLVSSGNRMVEFWDKRANPRDGKAPGIVEMLGYGIEQLKKYRDGQVIKASDPVANITSPSKTLIQGMITVKKLTNRVLGYDTDDNAVESRGGYGHDGGGYGHHVSYGGMGGLDPFALLAALAFGAFLLQLLLTLLNTSARSLDVVDLNTPLLLSDYHVPSFMTKMDKIFGTPTTRTKRSLSLDEEEENDMFNSIIDKLDGMYRTYKVVSNKPSCAKLYLCRLAVQEADADESTYTSKFYMYGLQHLVGDSNASDFVKSIQARASKGEEVNCPKEVKEDCDFPKTDN